MKETGAGDRYPVCFDPGNRVYLSATTDGYGAGVRYRHTVTFDDEPDLVWKLEHRALEGAAGGLTDRYEVVVYGGRYLRHARDGHLVLPLGVPKKIFLPFDVGAEAEVGRLQGLLSGDVARLGVVRLAALADLSRSPSFRRRMAVGVVASWDVDLERDPVDAARHTVSPLSTAVADLHAESADGLTRVGLRVAAGATWSTDEAWHPTVNGRAILERVLLAVNDRPLSLFLRARYDRDDELRGEVGVRFAVLAGRR